MPTILNLLTRDGAVYMSFAPPLTPEQYAELVKLSDMCDDATELRTQVAAWATMHGLRYSFEPGREPT